jgi:mono/diheme cytochrome c family protein
MNFLKTVLIFTAFSFFAFACTQTPTTQKNLAGNTATVVNSNANNPKGETSASQDELAAVRKIYTEKCVSCHKEDGTGGIADFDGTKIKVPDLTTDRNKKESDAEFIRVIENGEREEGMPAFKGKISEEDIRNLVKLIRSDFQENK